MDADKPKDTSQEWEVLTIDFAHPPKRPHLSTLGCLTASPKVPNDCQGCCLLIRGLGSPSGLQPKQVSKLVEANGANFKLGGRAAATAAANGPKSREISLPGAVTCARGIMNTK